MRRVAGTPGTPTSSMKRAGSVAPLASRSRTFRRQLKDPSITRPIRQCLKPTISGTCRRTAIRTCRRQDRPCRLLRLSRTSSPIIRDTTTVIRRVIIHTLVAHRHIAVVSNLTAPLFRFSDQNYINYFTTIHSIHSNNIISSKPSEDNIVPQLPVTHK